MELDDSMSGKNSELQTIASDLDERQLVDTLVKELKELQTSDTEVIALVGGPASGKGTLAEMMVKTLGKAATLSTDNYLKGDRSWRRANVEDVGGEPIEKYDAEFLGEQVEAICKLEEGQELGVPIYDGLSGVAISPDPTHHPDPQTYSAKVGRVNFLIVEGDFQLLKRDSLKKLIYLDVPDDVRLANRVYRDLKQRGESNEQPIIDNFNARQKSQFIPYTLPNKTAADWVIKVNAKPMDTPTPDRKFDYRFTVLSRV